MLQPFVPSNIQQAAETVTQAAKQNLPIFIQNHHTKSTFPCDGLLLDLTGLHRIGPVMGNAASGYVVQVEAGVSASELCTQLASQNLSFAAVPNDSTTIGGMFCGSSYPAIADSVLGITLIQSDGTPLTIARGQCFFDQTGCTLPDGRRLELGTLPQHSAIPCLPACGSDLLDLFAGSCGTLGIVALLALRLTPVDTSQPVTSSVPDAESQPLSETEQTIIHHVRRFFDPAQLLAQNEPTL